MKVKLLTTIMLLFLGFSLAFAEEFGPSVAVRKFTGFLPDGNSEVIPGLTSIFMVDLIDPLEQECNGRLIEWMRRAEVIQELEFQHTKYVNPSTAAPLGQLIQPDIFIDAKINGNDENFTFEFTVTNAETGEILAEQRGVESYDNIFDFGEKVAKELSKKLCEQRAGYKIYGVMDQGTIVGTICGSLDKPFTATSPEVAGSWNFSPTSPSAGTFTYAAKNVGGVPGSGGGSYVIIRTKEGGEKIQLSGSGSIHSPLGTFSAKITEALDLTPIKTCDKKGNK